MDSTDSDGLQWNPAPPIREILAWRNDPTKPIARLRRRVQLVDQQMLLRFGNSVVTQLPAD